MLNPELINRAPWHEFYGHFLNGNPPLILLLLALNTVFFILFVVRRINGKNKFRTSTAYTVQGLMIMANLVVINNEPIYKFIRSTSQLV